MREFLRKLIPKNIAGVIGLIQSVIPFIRELLTVATRICAILIPGDKDDKVVAWLKKKFDAFESIFQKTQGFFLQAGSLPLKGK